MTTDSGPDVAGETMRGYARVGAYRLVRERYGFTLRHESGTVLGPFDTLREALDYGVALYLSGGQDTQAAGWEAAKADGDRRGVCVHSGMQVTTCKATDICDCFDYPTTPKDRDGS